MSDKIRKYEGERTFYPSLFSRFFDDDFMGHFTEDYLPAVNIKESGKAFKLEISAPGLEKGDFKVEVNKNILTISAEKQVSHEEKDEDEKVIRQEFRSSSFRRSFTLPEHVDTDKIEAKEKNGVLHVKLPKKDEAKENIVKRIEIK